MASALLASRNETHWGEPKVYMRKNPNWKSNPNPNPKQKCSPRKQIYDRSSQVHGRQMDESAALVLAKSDDSSSLNRKFVSINNRKESTNGGYVTFNISAYSRKELKGLKKRLIAELDQVRHLSSRIESREFQSRSGYSATQFSGGYGGREVTSSTRPPPPSCSPEASGGRGLKQKQMMKVSGSKRPSQLDCGRDPKRLASDPANAKLLSGMMKRCGLLLTKLMKHKHGWIFNVPVDVVDMGLHDYNQIIKRPMDLGTVKSNLGKNLYASPLDFASDVRLTFNNALLYNPKGHDVYLMAEQLLARFEEMFEPEYSKYENERLSMFSAAEEMKQRPTIGEEMEARRSSRNQSRTSESAKELDRLSIPKLNSPPLIPKPASTGRALAERPVQAPAPALPAPASAPIAAAKQMGMRSVTGKQPPKPKARDPNKRDMTFEEKQKLSMNLQSLPQEKMDQVLQIIKKRDSNLPQHGDEIEVDIEYIDKETLWDLDRFVGYYKKMLSKMKRQATAAGQNSLTTEENKQSTIDEMPEAEPAGSVKKNKKGEVGGVEEEVDIGEDMPASNFPPVEIEKDAGQASRSSSSSSSSSDNSSSSDSDSGSSSGSDSDADDDEAQSPGGGESSKNSPRS